MRVDKFLVVSIDCWRYDALSRTHPLLNTPKFDLLTRDYALAERYFVTAPATRPSRRNESDRASHCCSPNGVRRAS